MNEAQGLQGEVLPEDSQLIAQPDAEEQLEAESSTAEEVENLEPEQAEEKKPRGVQKRIDELTANWREEQRTRQKLEQMLEQVLSQKKEPERIEQPAPTPQGEPKLDQFQTYEEYVAALADYKAEQRILAWQAEQRAQQEAQQRASVQTEFQKRAEQFKSEAPDFDLVAFNPALPVSAAMAEVLQESDMGPQVLYHLGKNPDEAARISRLSPTMAAKELGKLEVRLSLPQPKQVSSAPKPIAPLSGGGSTRAVDPDNMTTEEWLQWRNQQVKR